MQSFSNIQKIPAKPIHSISSTQSPSSSVQASSTNSSNNQTVNSNLLNIKNNNTVTRIDNDDDDPIGDVTTMVGIDLEAEKKTLLGSTKSAYLEQIRSCKDEKFLNINVLHKKFEEIGKLAMKLKKFH